MTLNASGGTFDTNGTTATLSGIISGTGGLTKSGTGTLTLSGANTYNGGTTVSAGTLTGTTTSLQGDITNNATVTFDQSTTGTYAGVMSGTGALTKAGSGTVTLSGANTYSGGTTLSGGTLSASADTNLGAAAGGLTFAGGTLQYGAGFSSARGVTLNAGGGTFDTNGDNATLSGVISGTGVLTKVGAGTLTLSGANSYTGGTTITAGMLQGNTTSLQGNITDNAVLIFDQATNGTFAGVISGSGSVTKQNAGTLTLSGANTYTGTTTVNAGTLAVNGSLTSNTTVNAGGILNGTGTITGNVITNGGGTLAPGNSIGTITVNGNYTQAAGSTLSIEANAAGQSDKLAVTGTATLNGGGVVVLPADGTYAVRTQYTILTAAGAVLGTFAGVTTSSAFLTPTLSYAPTDVFLTLAQTVSFGSVVTRGNAGRVARALDSVSDTATGDFATLITALQNLSAGSAEDAFTRLSGESHASSLAASGFSVGAVLGAVRDRLALSRAGGTSGGSASASPWPQNALAAVPSPARGLVAAASDADALALSGALDGAKGASWWLKGYGGTGGVNGDGAATGIDYRFGGVTGGADAALWPDVLVGGSVGYTRTDVDVQGRRDTTAIDMYSLTGYGSWSPRLLYVDALLGYAYNQSRTSRHIEVGTLERTAKGSHGGHTLASGVETGYRGQSGALLWTPFVGLTYVRQTEDAFTEHGAGDADLRVQSATLDSLGLSVGGRLGWRLRAGRDWSVTPEIGVRYTRELLEQNAVVTAALVGAPPATFRVEGLKVPRDEVMPSVGVRVGLGERVDAALTYSAAVRGDKASHVGSAIVRVRW